MSKIENKETKQVEDLIRRTFPETEAYRYNSASIRVRVIDSRFANKTKAERERMVNPILAELPESTISDITVLLLLAPQEQATSLMNLEFERPTPSKL